MLVHNTCSKNTALDYKKATYTLDKSKGISSGSDVKFLPEPQESAVADKLIDNASMSTNDALDLASDFLGKCYTEPVHGSGRFVSADGARVVRMGVNDILGKHGGGSHMNFEILEPNLSKPGKMKIARNIHVYLND